MPEQARATGTWLFGQCIFDSVSGLSHGDMPIALTPKSRALLALLLQADGAVVSRETIALSLWDSSNVPNASIERCIYLLRRALREATGEDQLVTHYGQGLQVKGPVTFHPQGGSVESASAARTSGGWHNAIGIMRVGRPSMEHMQTQLDQMIAAASGPEPPVLIAAATLMSGRTVRGHLPPLEGRRRLLALAEAALAATPDFAPALAIKAFATGVLGKDTERGLELADRAVSLEPSMALPRFCRTWVLIAAQRPDAALSEANTGLKFNPIERMLLSVENALSLTMGNDLAGVQRTLEERLAARPDLDSIHASLSIVHSLSGRHEEAIATAHRAVEVSEGDLYLQSFLAFAYAKAGNHDAAQAILDRMADPMRDFHAVSVAAPTLLAMGREEAALQAIAQGFAIHEPSVFMAEFDLRLKPLWPEIPRLRALHAAKLA